MLIQFVKLACPCAQIEASRLQFETTVVVTIFPPQVLSVLRNWLSRESIVIVGTLRTATPRWMWKVTSISPFVPIINCITAYLESTAAPTAILFGSLGVLIGLLDHVVHVPSNHSEWPRVWFSPATSYNTRSPSLPVRIRG